MNASTYTQLVQRIRTRARSGPTSTITQTTSWQWYELAWAVLVVGLFATAGRIIDVIVATGLVVTWIAGPAVVVSVVGHLAVIGLEIFPEVAWAVIAMELLLVAPMILELSLLASSREMAIHIATGLLVFTAITATGVWVSVPVGQLSVLLVAVFCVSIGGMYVQYEYSSVDAGADNQPATLAVESSTGSPDHVSASEENSQ